MRLHRYGQYSHFIKDDILELFENAKTAENLFENGSFHGHVPCIICARMQAYLRTCTYTSYGLGHVVVALAKAMPHRRFTLCM